MNRTLKGIFAPSRLRLALLAGAALGCASLQAQTTTVISDTFGSAAGPLHDRLPDTTVSGARWVSDANFTLAGSNSATATFATGYQTAYVDLGASYFSSPGVYTLSVDVDYAAGSKAGGQLGVSFMSVPDATSGDNQTIMLRDQLSTNQTAPGCVEYAKGGAQITFLTGSAIGGTDAPFTLTVVLVVKASGHWQMNSFATNKTTGETFYPRGSTGARAITSPSAIRYVGLLAGLGNADAPVITNFKLTRGPVTEPAFYYLDTNQTSGDWTTVANWNTLPTGLGTDAAVLADVHDYFTNNRILRSPMVGGPVKFPGGSLTIDGGGLELRQTNGTADVAIENLVSRGGFISNSAGAWVTRLNAANFAASKTGMDTVVSPGGSGRTVYLSVGRLAGAGTLDIHGGGVVQLAATDASRFTGKITKAAGTSLQLQGPITSKASVVISTPAEVNLNGHTLVVSALTVGGSVKSEGNHSASSLGFGGTGTVTVQTPPAEAETLFGVNLAIAEFGDTMPGSMGTDYAYPDEEEFDYYRARGIKLIRLPFRWERIQKIYPNGALDSAECTQIDLVLTRAAARGMKVILDMHNYNARKINGTPIRINSSPTVTEAHLADAWGKIAARYVNNTTVYGYDIMNEPGGTTTEWETVAKAVVTAIRAVDTNHFIIVENTSNAGAQYWKANTTLDSVNDGALNKMIYSAHSYWDEDTDQQWYSGHYDFGYDRQSAHVNLGREKAKIYVDWLNARGARGFVGEYGIPNNPAGAFHDIRWNNVLFRFLQYMEFNGISGTYWAGGPRWPINDPKSCEPDPITLPDRPVMSVMRAFGQPQVYEVEAVSAVASPNSVSVLAEPQMNAGSSKGLNAAAVGDSISYTLPNVPKGKYQIFVRVKKTTTRGKFQLYIDGSSTAQGTEQDQYSTTITYPELDLGSVTFSTTGNRLFQFRVSGKNAASSVYTLMFDSIRLQPL